MPREKQAADAPGSWRIHVDTGGTFTDALGVGPDGRRWRGKLLSSDEAPGKAVRELTGVGEGEALPPVQMRLATTRGTNALLEENGAEVVFFVTEGFGDLLRIGDQRRPDLFTLNVTKPAPLHAAVVEVGGRMDPGGDEVLPLDLESARGAAREQVAAGRRVAATCLLHSYRNDEHEQALKECLLDCGFEFVACSSELAPFIKVLPRAETVVVDAYLGPLMREYLDAVQGALGDGTLRVMTSAGGLVSREKYQAKDSLLSGPAGGVVGAAAVARRAGLSRVVTFDMGGTSTDVSRFDGDFNYCETHTVGRARLMAPALRIETVAAGGGSICSADNGLLRVGPESAGAHPGPACYGAGGPLTITDVNLLLGRLDLETFNLPVYPKASESAFNTAQALHGGTREEVLQGLLEIANERMANVIRKISVREGYDVTDHALVAFGGAGGQHACGVAELLGMERILFPADAGLLSAFGLEQARVERIAEAQVLKAWSEAEGELSGMCEAMGQQAVTELTVEGVGTVDVRRRTALMRFGGQESVLEVDFARTDEVKELFLGRYQETFGYVPSDREIEVVSLRVIASTLEEALEEERFNASRETEASRVVQAFHAGEWRETPVYARDDLGEGAVLMGPAVVSDAFGTLVVDCGWRGMVGTEGSLLLERCGDGRHSEGKLRVAGHEIFTNRLTAVVEEMGAQLERTAISTNIKERLDFSCALLDAKGRLIVNAPHIPVHLGALGLCVREVAARLELGAGDVAVTNHPAFGGSHLPDVTLIAPVMDDAGVLMGYVANRAHHAEIGGIVPGSMSPEARVLEEEGVVIAPQYLFKGGKACGVGLEACLREARFPTRCLEENLADLQAQVAAIRRGEQAWRRVVGEFGAETVCGQMDRIRQRAAAAVDSWLVKWEGKDLQSEQKLDNGAVLKVRVTVLNGRMVVDFTGTSAMDVGCLNATPAIVRSVLVYVLRLLVGEEMPLNEGLLEPVEVVLPQCFLNPVFGGDAAVVPAVFGGNVEVSQRLADMLLLAFGVAACGQGTMNNWVMGDSRRSYYETIGGGGGAADGCEGGSGMHVHMSNTAITDPEILEWRFPVRLWRFALRKGSGGDGQWRGGDGLVREVEFLAPLSVSLLGLRRDEGPEGLAGGLVGSRGRQTMVRADGHAEVLDYAVCLKVGRGDRLVMETPGGGGYGSSARTNS
ncbi:MAG: 5-oxoprolinase [Verrucomicrobiales bacterium]|nr:5-oxoprolinase [Verrucomicrobiales bacterium]|tara:strand:+ start:20485 stop:24042 length:3558 start_codon:yes stop_codon:yes gene_type:complete